MSEDQEETIVKSLKAINSLLTGVGDAVLTASVIGGI